MAILKPSPGSPSTFSAGTRMPLKVSSRRSLPSRPRVSKRWPTSNPSMSASTMNAVCSSLTGGGEGHERRALAAVADVVLLAVQPPGSVGLALGPRLQAGHVRPRAGLGEREAGELLARAQVGQEPLLLLVGAEQDDALHADRHVHAEHHRQGRVDLRELLRDAAVAGLGQALAAVLLRHVQAQDPALGQPLDGLVPHPALLLDLVGVVGQVAHRLAERADLVLLGVVGLGEGEDELLVDLAEVERLGERGDALAGVGLLLGGGRFHRPARPPAPFSERGLGPDVLRRWPDQLGLSLLLHDVRGPAAHARAGEQRGEQLGRDVGEVEHHRRPELDVGGQHAVGLAGLQLGQRGLLELLGRLQARGVDLLGGATQHSRAGVLGPVDAVAEAHQPLAAVEQVLHVALGVALALDAVEHVQHPRGRAAVQRAAQRAHGAAQRGGNVGARGGDHPGGEGGRVHAVLGGRDPVGVDGLDVARVGLAAPADEEALGDRSRLVDLQLGDGRAADAASRLGDERQRHDRAAGEVVAGLLVGDVDHLLEPPLRGQHGQRGLEVGARVAGAHRKRVRLRRRQAGLEAAVHQQAPHLLEADLADQVLDVDAAVAQRAALLVGLGDRRPEGDYSLEARGSFDYLGHWP